MLAKAALAASVLSASPGARAEKSPVEPIRIEYRAEAGCPSADEFNAQVFRRTTSARLATSGELARTFIVTIERRGNGLTGSLIISQADGTSESREVAGPGCSEVATVLALATALAIDPQASLATEPPPAPAPKPEPAPPPPPTKVAPAPAEPEVKDVAGFVASLGPALEAGIAPRVTFGGTLELAWRAAPGEALSSAGVELTYLRAPKHEVGTAETTFQFIYARPSLCSMAFHWSRGSGIAPCLASELGAVTGSGTGLPHAATHTRFWATVDLGVRVIQSLGRHWFVAVDGAAVLPLTRYEYVFEDPNTPVYAVPSVASFASVRFGARL
jgi:hypothetical protein